MTDSIIQHLLENKKHTANHRNSKKTTTFVFNKCSVTYLRKCPIIQHLVSDSGHSQKRLKESGTTHICKAMKYTDLHLSPHSVYLSKQRLYRLKWTVTDNQWCKYAASGNNILDVQNAKQKKTLHSSPHASTYHIICKRIHFCLLCDRLKEVLSPHVYPYRLIPSSCLRDGLHEPVRPDIWVEHHARFEILPHEDATFGIVRRVARMDANAREQGHVNE